jgi:hypothetical protein
VRPLALGTRIHLDLKVPHQFLHWKVPLSLLGYWRQECLSYTPSLS